MSEDPANIKIMSIWDISAPDPSEIREWLRILSRNLIWQRYEAWRRKLEIPCEAKTMEAGCGHGKFSMLLGLTGAHVWLMDYNETAIESARAAHGMVGLQPECVVGSILNPDAGLKGTFDVVCSFGTLEHFLGEHREEAVARCAELLRPGGMMYFSVPNRYGFMSRAVIGIRSRLGQFKPGFFEMPYSRKELSRLAEAAGLESLFIGGGSTLWEDFRYWILGNVKSALRKPLRFKKTPRTAAPEEIDRETALREIENAPRAKEPGLFGDLFSGELIFVGRKK